MASMVRRLALASALALSFCANVNALIVGNVPGVVPDTTVNPASYPGWTQGDPGWSNVSAEGSNYVYLGDGWVLSARHVGYSESAGVKLQTMLPNGSPGPVKTFHRIPGSYYLDYGVPQNGHQYAVSNPTTIQSETGQTISLQDSNGTYFSDLQIFRISEDPGLPSLKIASELLPSDFTRTDAPEVVAIARGRARRATETHWNVTQGEDWTWTETTGTGTHQGYRRVSNSTKRFGTNRLTDIRPNFSGDPADPGATNYSNLFDAEGPSGNSVSGVVSDTTAVLELKSGGVTRRVISIMTVFDRENDPGALDLEFQGQGGNSGSSIFYKRGDQWELAGIMSAVFLYPDQPASTGIYGNATLMSDLSYYNQDYFNSLKYIMDTHQDYSIIGDVNLDGVISGDGTGLPADDDVAAFVAGWGFNNETGQGTLTSWRNGDLNRDGKTDVNDFLSLRDALNGPVSSAVLTTLFGGDWPLDGGDNLVPEPASAASATIAVLFALSIWRRRARCGR